jgi:non-specific serine/threonine protein kinase
LLKDSKGLAYLAMLLRHPGRSFHALELQAGPGPEPELPSGNRRDRPGDDAFSMRRGRSEAGGELHDARAHAAYRARLGELRVAIAEARALNDLGRTELLQREADVLVDELARAEGLGGRPRRFSSAAERARLNVSRAIRTAIAHVSQRLPALGQHLRRSVRTGVTCSYDPEPGTTIDWDL